MIQHRSSREYVRKPDGDVFKWWSLEEGLAALALINAAMALKDQA